MLEAGIGIEFNAGKNLFFAISANNYWGYNNVYQMQFTAQGNNRPSRLVNITNNGAFYNVGLSLRYYFKSYIKMPLFNDQIPE